MSFVASIEVDELQFYDLKCFFKSVVDDVQKPFGDVRFRVSKSLIYPNLARVALWFLVVSVFSALSERDFGFLNNLLTPE